MIRLSEVVRQQGSNREEAMFPSQEDCSLHPSQERSEKSSLFENCTSEVTGEVDWVKEAEKAVIHLGRGIKQKTALSLERFDSIALGIVQSSQKNEDLIREVFSRRSTVSRLTSNSVNVAILATRISLGLYREQQDLTNIAKAGLLHNIGKFSLPPHIANPTSTLTSEDKRILEQHPEVSKEILEALVPTDSWLIETLLQVHERWDGQGYPQGRKGEQIHPYARIIGLADTFETMVNQEHIQPHGAIRQLLTMEKTAFPGNLVKMLVQQITLFPVGTSIQLSTNETAVVEKTNPRYPLRPVVKIINNSSEGIDHPLMRDLSFDHLIHIIGVVKT